MNAPARATLILLCATGILLRVAASAAWPSLAHPDETIQYLEQAYRLDTGRGLVPWEYVVGARSWLLPLLLAPMLKLGLAVSPLPEIYLWSTTLAMIAVATAGIIAAFYLGYRAGGLPQAACAGGLVAIWCELVQLSPHALADTAAAVPLLAGLATAYRCPAPSTRRLAAAGALFGLAFALRIQLAPAIGVAMLGLCWPALLPRGLRMAAGFALPLVVFGVIDWIALGAPFRSLVVYLRVNGGGVAAAFGTTPPWAYLAEEGRCWGLAALAILPTAWLGARRLPLPALVAATILVTFSLVGHKEARFIYPALPLLFVLSGVGTADLAALCKEWAARRWGDGRRRMMWGGAIWGGAALGWLILSAFTAAEAPMQERWHAASGWLRALARIDADPAACGVGVTPPRLWFLTGQVRLRADVPLYAGDAGADAAAYDDRLVAEPSQPPSLGAYRRVACDGWAQKVCTYRREGGCDPGAGHRLQAAPEPPVAKVLRRLGFD